MGHRTCGFGTASSQVRKVRKWNLNFWKLPGVFLTFRRIDWLIDWFVGTLVGWLIDWLIDWLIAGSIWEPGQYHLKMKFKEDYPGTSPKCSFDPRSSTPTSTHPGRFASASWTTTRAGALASPWRKSCWASKTFWSTPTKRTQPKRKPTKSTFVARRSTQKSQGPDEEVHPGRRRHQGLRRARGKVSLSWKYVWFPLFFLAIFLWPSMMRVFPISIPFFCKHILRQSVWKCEDFSQNLMVIDWLIDFFLPNGNWAFHSFFSFISPDCS